jgi:16S rRNA (cytidine1402-2'-O)-methyltransferase
LAEDTRRAGLLLAACGLGGKRLISLHEHNEEARLPLALQELAQGRTLALISDAGTPLLADPGYKLVRACRSAGHKVSPLPGPCAALAALAASGLPPQPFVFLGFPPRKAGDQQRFFTPFAALPLTLIFFERKDRLRATLERLHVMGGQREICLARELTKTYEEFIFFTLGDFSAFPQELLGEITVVAGPPAKLDKPAPDAQDIAFCHNLPLKPRAKARLLREQNPGLSADESYRLMVRTESGAAQPVQPASGGKRSGRT